MEKYFLLIAGDHYYPQSGTQDWIKTFSSEEEAKSYVTKIRDWKYLIQDVECDWYQIVDLRKFIYE